MDLTDFTENHIETEKVPVSEGTTDVFTKSDWNNEDEVSKAVDKVWQNLSSKMDEADWRTDLSMMYEFVMQHCGNRFNKMKNEKRLNQGLVNRAADLYRDIFTTMQSEAEAWNIDDDDMRRNGKYLQVANAISTKFSGGSYDAVMYFLTRWTLQRMEKQFDALVEHAESEKGLFNRSEQNTKIEGYAESSSYAVGSYRALEEAWQFLHQDTEEWFS